MAVHEGSGGTMQGPYMLFEPQVFVPCLPLRTQAITSPGTQKAYADFATLKNASANTTTNLAMNPSCGNTETHSQTVSGPSTTCSVPISAGNHCRQIRLLY